jgi:hypothetical protein
VLRIRIANYRGSEAHEVHFGPGVTVIEGPNEAGKSSLAEALDLIFEYFDNSTDTSVRNIFPVHRDAHPEIEVEIETGPYAFRYRKCFGLKTRAAFTELHILRPKPENLTGRDAHERAHQLLADTLDVDLWKAIRIEQGRGIDQAVLAESSALARALDAASGGTSDNEGDPALFERVQEEYQRYYTAKEGKAKGELVEAEQRVARLRAQVVELEAEQRAIERHVAESTQLADRRRRLDEELPKRLAELERWVARAQVVEVLRKELATTQVERERTRRDLEATAHADAERTALARSVAEQQARIGVLEAEQRASAEQVDGLARQITAAKQRRDEARGQADAAERRERLARADAESRRRELEAVQLGERLARAREQQTKARDAAAVLATNRVTREALHAIQEADYALREAQRRLEEGGPRLALHALSEIRIDVDEEPVTLAEGETRELPVARERTLRVPGALEIRLQPGTSTGELEAARARAARELTARLERHGVASLEAATNANVAREDAVRIAAEAEQRLADLLRDLRIEELEDKAHRARAAVDDHLVRRGAEPEFPATLDDAKKALARAEAMSHAAKQEAERTAAAYEPLLTHHEQKRNQRSHLDGQLDHARHDLAGLAGRLAASRSELPDDALRKLRDEAAARTERVEAAWASLAQRLEVEQPDEVEARRRSVQAALDHARSESHQLDTAAARVGALLEVTREAGLFERLEAARSQLDHAERARESLVRRAAAARLLVRTLSRHREAARRAYVEPLRQRIETLGRVVFGPSFAIQLGQDLAIETRTLDDTTLAFDQLTTGTREQLGLLTRLAAAMIVAPHEGVPLIVDDALGHSDPERIERMNAAIGLAECQVIILTCWPERFRGIAGAHVERL